LLASTTPSNAPKDVPSASAGAALGPISPALPCFARSSAAGGSAGFKSSQVSHAKPPRFAGNDKPSPAAAARVMQQHAGQAL